MVPVNIAGSEGLKVSAVKAERFVGNLTSKVHIIIQFPVLNETLELVEARNGEYLDTLRRNLAHPQVNTHSSRSGNNEATGKITRGDYLPSFGSMNDTLLKHYLS